MDYSQAIETLDNYLERAVKDNLNVVDVLDHILSAEAFSKRKRAIETQIQTSGFPMKKGLDDFDFNFQPSIDKRQIDELATMRFLENAENIVFLGPPGVGKTHLATALGMAAAEHRCSTYYVNCHALIEQLKKAHFENHLPDKLRVLGRYRLLIIDEIGYLPMDIQGANLFFQLIARRYEKSSTIFTSNKTFSQWNDIFADVTIASAILDRVLHHCNVIHIKGESYRLKERKEYMKQKVQLTNTLFEKADS
ncbi:IstB helper protein [Clostridia bacterium]|nr:IstB helper protein [Clostridia bacterium]